MYYRDKDDKIIRNKEIREGYNSTEYYGKNKKLSTWWILIITLASLIIVLLIAWLIWWAVKRGGKKKLRFYSPTVSRFRFGRRFY